MDAPPDVYKCSTMVVVACLATPALCAVSYAGVRAALLNDRYRISHAGCTVYLLSTRDC